MVGTSGLDYRRDVAVVIDGDLKTLGVPYSDFFTAGRYGGSKRVKDAGKET